MELLKISFRDSTTVYGCQLLFGVIDYTVVKTQDLDLQVKRVY